MDNVLAENLAPDNICKPPIIDTYMKELLDENNYKKVVSLDQTFLGIQQSIHTILGPLPSMWIAAEQEKKDLSENVVADDLHTVRSQGRTT